MGAESRRPVPHTAQAVVVSSPASVEQDPLHGRSVPNMAQPSESRIKS
jgi:hypothetical protein